MTDWKQNLLDKGEKEPRMRPYVWNGIDCQDGWRPLVEAFYALAEKHPCMQLAQIKEKYGTLRLYWSHDAGKCIHEGYTDGVRGPAPNKCWDRLSGTIDGLEYASSRMCELCGQYGMIRTENRWVTTRCDSCFAEGK